MSIQNGTGPQSFPSEDGRPQPDARECGGAGSDGSREFIGHYEQWSGAVYRYLVHLIGSGGEADDLFQDTWARAFKLRHQLRDPKLFSVWIFRIARNLAFNEMRKSRRKGQVWILSNLSSVGGRAMTQDENEENPLDRFSTGDAGPLDRTIDGQRREIIQEAVAQLDLASQEMLQLRYFEGFSLAEIAQFLNVPLGTVCTKIHRGLRMVQESLKRKGIRTLEEI